MKKTLKIAVAVTVIIVAGLAAVALVTEPKWQVLSTTSIGAPADRIRPYLLRLTSWPEWTVWNASNYPGMKIQHDGPAEGVGAIQRWTDGSDSGQIELTHSEPARVHYRVEMNKGEYTMDGNISLLPNGATTSVVWQVSGDVGNNPVHRVFLVVMKPFMTKQLEENLAGLKEKIERRGRT